MKEKRLSHRRIRVLHVLSDGRPSGVHRYVVDLCARLSRDRYSVELCFLRSGPLVPLAEQEGLHTSVVGWSRPNDVVAAARFGGYLQTSDIDILHAHHVRRRVRLIAQRCGVRHIIHHLHTVPPRDELPYRRGGVAKWLESGMSNCDRCVIGSRFLRSQITSLPGHNMSKLAFVLPGINFTRWQDHPSKEAAKAALRIPADTFVIGTASRMIPPKRLDLFLELAAAVRAERPRALFLICGDGPLRTELEAKATALRLEDTVRFLGWRRDLLDPMSAFDVFAATNVEDNFAQSVLEPMAMGQAVVGFTAGSMPDWVESGESGLLVPTGDVNALRDAVISLLDYPDQCRKMGQLAQARCREKFGISLPVQRVQELYESLLAASIQSQGPWSE
jgi:glycosyltransferase involved in cell wall biosynthesis